MIRTREPFPLESEVGAVDVSYFVSGNGLTLSSVGVGVGVGVGSSGFGTGVTSGYFSSS